MNTASHASAILEAAEPPRIAVNFAPILRALTVRGIGLMDVVKVIDSHAIIVARLIALANSAWSNPAKPITALPQACTRLGLDVVRTVSIALCVCRSFNLARCTNFDPLLHWLCALMAADICAALAQARKQDTGTARAAGLLHNIGILWLADRFPVETDRALTVWNPADAHSLDALMRAETGIGYLDAGNILVRKLGLPAVLCNLIAEACTQDPAKRSTGLIQTAAGIASCVLHEERDITTIATTSRLPEELIRQQFDDCTARLDRYRHLAGLLSSA